MADDKLTYKIEAWLLGDLPQNEAAEFQAQMQGDPALGEEVELHRLTLQAMQRLSENDLQEKVSNWLDDLPIEHPPGNTPVSTASIPWRTWLWISIAGLLLLSAGVFGVYKWDKSREKTKEAELATLQIQFEKLQREIFELRQEPPPNSANMDSLNQVMVQMQKRIDELQGQKQKPIADVSTLSEDPTFATLRGEKNTVDSIYEVALVAYNGKKFQVSASLCEEILEIEKENKKATRLLAYSYFRSNKFVDALGEFKNVANTPSYRGEAEWHIMLCHKAFSVVDSGEKELYMADLKRLAAEGDSKFKLKAQALLKKELSRTRNN